MAGYFTEASAKLGLDITQVEKNLAKAGVMFGQFGDKATALAALVLMLAGSMHQLAAMVGPSLVVADLLPVIEVGRCR